MPIDRAEAQPDPQTPILLFDGVCNLCHATVRFVADRDSKRRFRFAFLQSPAGQRLMRMHALPSDSLDSVVLIHHGGVYRKSTAMLRVLRELDGPWPMLAAFLVVPRRLRDWCYDLVGQRRYRWFGRKDSCAMPREDLRARFLE